MDDATPIDSFFQHSWWIRNTGIDGDDTGPNVHPGAKEIMRNAIDYDCYGAFDG